MGQRVKDLNLPDFAFIEGWGRKDETLHGRNVILCVRSASVVEILEKDGVLALREDVLTHDFDYINRYGVVERFVCVLHYSATLDKDADRQMLIDKVMVPACDWFTEYMDWEDENITKEGL